MGTDSFSRTDFTSPTAFYFSVKIAGFDDMDCSFQEVSGLKVTIGTVEKKEGGDNVFVHHLPIQPKYENLVLKRCLSKNLKLEKWSRDAIEDFKFDPKDIKVALLGANGGILASWSIVKAFPVSWELSALNNTSN